MGPTKKANKRKTLFVDTQEISLNISCGCAIRYGDEILIIQYFVVL
jgi:hypothetical protein